MDRHGQAKTSSKESKEDRLLRKAREYVEREERKSQGRGNKPNNIDNGNDEEERRKQKHRSKRENDDRHRKSRKHSRKRSDSESFDDNRTSKRCRRGEVDERRRREKEKKKKSKQSSSRDEKKPPKDRVDKSTLSSLGDIAGKPPATLLDPDKDYFAFHQHLWVYLYREEGIAFGDLTSDEARHAFQRFCRYYNEGKLEAAYYQDILPLKAVEESKTTRHKWSFQTSATEAMTLSVIEKGVRKQTEYEAVPYKPLATVAGHAADVSASEDICEKTAVDDKLQEYRANKRLREHVRTVGEELTGGRKDGRERQLEKKKETAASLHGAARDREDAGVELGDADLYGDGNAEFSTALARERRYKEKRSAEKESRLAELQQKENERQQAMLNALGLTGIKPGQKITIAPRKDT
jgi:hypothetical protein